MVGGLLLLNNDIGHGQATLKPRAYIPRGGLFFWRPPPLSLGRQEDVCRLARWRAAKLGVDFFRGWAPKRDSAAIFLSSSARLWLKLLLDRGAGTTRILKGGLAAKMDLYMLNVHMH